MWSVQYTDLFGKKMVESFHKEEEAVSRYEELLPRTYGEFGDINKVFIKESNESTKDAYDWDDFGDVVRRIMVGLEIKPNGKVFRTDDTAGVKTIRFMDGTPLVSITMDYNNGITITNISLNTDDFEKAFDICKSGADQLISAFGGDEDIAVTKVDRKNEDGASAASLGVCPTGSSQKDSVNEAESSLEAAYGDGHIYTGESSADGFYGKNSPLSMAVLNNDIDMMKALRDGTAPTPDKPWKISGWVEDIDAPEDADGNFPYVYDMDTDYNQTFVEDFDRVVGKKDNEEALNLLLEYYPDFFVASIDFNNAFHKGYSKDLLRTLLSNIRAAVGDDEDLSNNYLAYDEFGDDPIKNLTEFLGE